MTLSLVAITRQDCVLRPFDKRITRHNVQYFRFLDSRFSLTSVFSFFEILADNSVCQNLDPYNLLEKYTSNKSFPTYVVAVSIFLNVATVTVNYRKHFLLAS